MRSVTRKQHVVQATLGVGSVDVWSFTVAWTRGRGFPLLHAISWATIAFNTNVQAILLDEGGHGTKWMNVFIHSFCGGLPCLGKVRMQ